MESQINLFLSETYIAHSLTYVAKARVFFTVQGIYVLNQAWKHI